jgi:hypothetical protein
MKKLLPLFILMLLIGCSTSKYYVAYVQHIDSRAEGNKFIDSLRTLGMDTIIGYYDGCSGCVEGFEKPYYIFWDSKNTWHLIKFTTYSKYNEITGYSPPIKYVSENIESIENGKLNAPQFELLHFHYDAVRIIFQNKETKYEINDFEKFDNESAPKVILIDKIRSELLGIFPSDWKGLNYMTEKRIKKSS